jgi:hypothetical protein
MHCVIDCAVRFRLNVLTRMQSAATYGSEPMDVLCLSECLVA